VKEPKVPALADLKRRLRPGRVYRRSDLARWSNAVDRHLKQLLAEGRLEKVSAGLYMAPRKTRFGAAPAKPEALVEAFLGDSRFLMVPPNAFNALRVGTTQLYNAPVVYNHKRHGRIELDGRPYEFRKRAAFPSALSEEFLVVDLLHNADRLAEDSEAVRRRALVRAQSMSPKRLKRAVREFDSARARRLLEPVLEAHATSHAA